MADLLGLQDCVASLFVASPLGKVLLAKDRVVRLLLHTGSGGSGRVRSVQGRDKPPSSIQQTLLGGFALGDGSKQFGMVTPVLTRDVGVKKGV